MSIVGLRFGNWEVIEESPHNKRYVLCRCNCEDKTEKEIYKTNLTSGKSKSCGCFRDNNISKTKSKYNTYDLSEKYGIGYTIKGEPFYFDLEDYDLIKDYCWRKETNGYIVSNIKGDNRKLIKMHRLIMNVYKFEIKVDHIFHNKFDNRKEYLRIVNNINNSKNKQMQSNNTSGVIGVYYDKNRDRWCAEIKVDKVKIYLGRYKDIEEAKRVREDAEIKYFGEYRLKISSVKLE